MPKKNIIYIILGMLSIVILIQGYLLYELKQEVGRNSTDSFSMTSTELSADPFRSFTSDKWDPFEEMQRIQRDMQETFGNFNSHFMDDPKFKDTFKGMRASPLSDIEDKGDHYLITMNLPGTQDKNIEIDVKDDRISITAKVQKNTESNASNYIRKERYVQHFQRSFILPDDADGMNLKHEYKDGVLIIKVAKNNG